MLDGGFGGVDDAEVYEVVVTVPACLGILVGVDEEEHPVGVGVGGEGVGGFDVEGDVLGVVCDLAEYDIVSAGGVAVEGLAVASVGSVGGVADGVAVFGNDGGPVGEVAVD